MCNNYSLLFFSIFIFCFFLIHIFSYLYEKKYTQSNYVTTLAGPCIFLSFILFSFLYINNVFLIFNNLYELLIFYFSIFLIVIIGVIDDFIKISTLKKIIFQIFIVILTLYGLGLNQVNILSFSSNYFINYIFLIIFVLGFMNSINLIDGIDNIAGMLSIVISIFFILLAKVIGFNEINIFFYMVIGSLASYLLYSNFFKRIFIGDAGSLFLGWLFSLISIFFINFSNKVTIIFSFAFLFIPVFDVIYVMIFRFYNANKKGFLDRLKSIFIPDRIHLHHSLLKLGISNFMICFILCLISSIFSLIYIKYVFYFDTIYKYLFINILFITYMFIRIRIDRLI